MVAYNCFILSCLKFVAYLDLFGLIAFCSTKQRNDHGERCLFKFSYKKLPTANANNCIAHKLNVEMAPLSLTFIPGLVDRLKQFFSVHGFYFNLRALIFEIVFLILALKLSTEVLKLVCNLFCRFLQIRIHLLVTLIRIFICITP